MRYTNKLAMDYDDYLNANLDDRARDKFYALPDFYTKPSSPHQYANIQDAADGITQGEWIVIARLLRDGKHLDAGKTLECCLKRICERDAEEELEKEWEDGKPQADALAERADYLYQRRRDDAMEKE